MAEVAARWRVGGVLALLAALTLAGCGSGSGASPGGTAPSGSATRTITDAQGRRVTVPAHPTRVLALSEPTLDGALALGVAPVGTTDGRGQSGVSAYLAGRAKGIATIGILGQPDIERVLELHPDLILTDGTSIQSDAILDKLRHIAPTVYVSKTGQDWKTAFAAEADVLGEKARGTAVLGAFDRRVAAVRGQLGPNTKATVSVVRWSGVGLPDVIPAGLAAGRTLTALGLRRPGTQSQTGPGHAVPISLENLDQLDADWMFFASLGAGGPSGGAKAASAGVAASRRALALARGTPGFENLNVVKAGHVEVVDGSAWTSAGGPLAEGIVLDDVQRAMAGRAR